MERTPTNPSPEDEQRPFRTPGDLLRAALEEDDGEVFAQVMTDALRQDILEALALGEPIDEMAARFVAFALEAFIDGEQETTLDRFFQDGIGTPTELRAIYAPLFDQRRVAAEFEVMLDYFGTYLFHQDRPQTAPRFPAVMEGSTVFFDTQPDGRRVSIGFAARDQLNPAALGSFNREVGYLVAEHGDAMRAYLRLPGVDVHAPDLIGEFQDRSLGPVSGPDAQPLSDEEIAAGVDWDAVEIAGILHAFRIPSAASPEGND